MRRNEWLLGVRSEPHLDQQAASGFGGLAEALETPHYSLKQSREHNLPVYVEDLGLTVTIEPAKDNPEQGRVTVAYQDLVQRTEDRDQRTEGEPRLAAPA